MMKHLWPQDSNDPFGIQCDFNWQELGAILRVIGTHDVRLVIETGVSRGDLAAWMIAKSRFDPEFQYLGITNNPNSIDPKIKTAIESGQSGLAFVAVGAPCSDFILNRVSKLVRNSSCAMVLCDGTNIDREVARYLAILRPGDVIMAHRFLEEYNGNLLFQWSQSGKLDRITGNWMTTYTRLIAGIVL